jgi:hypothetical protein
VTLTGGRRRRAAAGQLARCLDGLYVPVMGRGGGVSWEDSGDGEEVEVKGTRYFFPLLRVLEFRGTRPKAGVGYFRVAPGLAQVTLTAEMRRGEQYLAATLRPAGRLLLLRTRCWVLRCSFGRPETRKSHTLLTLPA